LRVKLPPDAPLEEIETEDVTFEGFVKLYNDHFNYVTPDTHKPVIKRLDATHPRYITNEDGEEERINTHRVLMGFRQLGKTHLIGLWVCWRLFLDPEFTVLIISADRDLAGKTAKFIKDVIEAFWLTKHLVPKNKERWRNEYFVVERPKGRSKDPSVLSTSVGSQITGSRAKCILADDIEVPTNSNSQAALDQLWKEMIEMHKIANEFLIAGTPHGGAKSVYKKALELKTFKYVLIKQYPVYWLKDGVRYDEPVEGGEMVAINTTVRINGEYQDLKWLAKQRELGESVFRSQYMLEFVSYDDMLLDPRFIHTYAGGLRRVEDDLIKDAWGRPRMRYTTNGELLVDLCGYWDIAFGTRGRDDSVLSIVGVSEAGNYYIIHSEALPPKTYEEGFKPQVRAIIDVCKKFHLDKLYVESNKESHVIVELRTEVSAQHLGGLAILEDVQHRYSGNKIQRIGNAIEPLVSGRRLWVAEDAWRSDQTHKLFEQVQMYPNGKHDDFIDSVAGAIKMLSQVRIEYGDKPFGTDLFTGQKANHVEANTFKGHFRRGRKIRHKPLVKRHVRSRESFKHHYE
jgi:phage terminase large subunit-like protein